MTRQKKADIIVIIAAICVLLFAVWGPEKIAKYKDRSTLDHIISETVEDTGEGYRYTLSENQKLYILSKCLDGRSVPESELSSLTDMDSQGAGYEEITGTYAFVINRQGPSDMEITSQEIFNRCNEQLAELKELGVIPESVKDVSSELYSAELYSAIDVLEPRNNMSVWKVSLLTDTRNANKADRVIDAYIDADSGKIYEFYVRGNMEWNDIDPDEVVGNWSDYLGLYGMEAYDSVNPLLESTPDYAKYRLPAGDDASTVVTLGFYEGIINSYF